MRSYRKEALSLMGQLVVATALAVAPAAQAQVPADVQAQQNSQVSMALFPVVQSPDGRQFVVLRNGQQLPIPGAGVAPGSQQMSVYRDPQGNFWYTDRNGQPVKVTMRQIQWAVSHTAPPPGAYGQGTGYPAPVQQTTVVQEPPQQSSGSSEGSGSGGSSGSSALATGLAAAGGAALGSMLTNSYYDNHYYGMPYGTPMYMEGGNRYYYVNPSGQKVYVDHNANTAAVANQWKQQGHWENRQQWAAPAGRQQAQSAASQAGQFQSRRGDATGFDRGSGPAFSGAGERQGFGGAGGSPAFGGSHQRPSAGGSHERPSLGGGNRPSRGGARSGGLRRGR